MMETAKNVTILLVEDNPGHARLVEKNLRRANLNNPIVILKDGGQAMDYLFRQGAYSGEPIPENLLVLLDLNLPVMDGYQVLSRMKENEAMRRIPVIVLTTTDDPREIDRCYDLGCNVYLTKPVDYEEFSEAIRKLGLFLSVVTVPKEGACGHE
jgi:CheY-like chemotaxis protein